MAQFMALSRHLHTEQHAWLMCRMTYWEVCLPSEKVTQWTLRPTSTDWYGQLSCQTAHPTHKCSDITNSYPKTPSPVGIPLLKTSIWLSWVLYHHHLCPLASLCSSCIGRGPSHICWLLLAGQGQAQDKCDINSNCWSHQRSYQFTHGGQWRLLPLTLTTQPAHYNDQKLKRIITAVKFFIISNINFINRSSSLLQSNQTTSGAHLASHSIGTRHSFHRANWPVNAAGHSTPARVNVQNKWSYTSTPFIRYRSMHRDYLNLHITFQNVVHTFFSTYCLQ